VIVRILGDGQYELDEAAAERLGQLDVELNTALEAGDEGTFDAVLAMLVEAVRSTGSRLGTDRIVPSGLTLPHEGATLGEVAELLNSSDADQTAG